MAGTYRMYSDENDIARLETLDVLNHPVFKSPVPTKSLEFRVYPKGSVLDWHPAPRRQWVIIIAGQLEIGFEDGSKHVFGPGDCRLVEDITGKGHTTTSVGDVDCLAAQVPLADQ